MKMQMIFAAFEAVVLAGCASAPMVDNSVVGAFDLERYLGEWHEIARYDHWFERGMTETKAAYTRQADGSIAVRNTGVKDGKPKSVTGKAKATATPGLLRVSFFGPFYSDYRVMMLADDYRYALVGGSDGGYLWILARAPQLPETDKAALLSEAARRGYDTSKLIWLR